MKFILVLIAAFISSFAFTQNDTTKHSTTTSTYAFDTLNKWRLDQHLLGMQRAGQIQKAIAGSNAKVNVVDTSGKRQGFWMITGAMKNDYRFAKDSVVEEGMYIDNKKTGVWYQFYPSGTTQICLAYKNGRPNGYAYTYFESGHLEEEGYWIGSRWVGEYKQFYENDSLREHFNYNQAGQRDGTLHYYYENGKVLAIANYKNGKEDGWQFKYSEDDTLIGKSFYNDGVIDPAKSWEKPVIIGSQQNPDRAVTQPNTSNPWGIGEPFILYKDGKISMKGTFKHYKLVDGEERIYDDHGILIQRKAYRDGKYIGDLPIPADANE